MYDPLIAAMFILPFTFWVGLALSMRGNRFEMDNGMGVGSFFAIFAIYRRLGFVIFSVSLLGAITAADQKWPPATIICSAAALYALLFNFWLNYNYESYLHAKYPTNQPPDRLVRGQSNYSSWKYATTMALGFSALSLFVVGAITFLMTVIGR